MSWLNKTLSSSIGKKLMVATSGLLLILFLVGHLAGNLSLLKNDNGEAFNLYAHFMSTNPGVQLMANVFKLFFLIHIVYAIGLVLKNKAARGGQGYSIKNPSGSGASKIMGVLGSLIFVFLVIHLSQYWAKMHGFYGTMPEVTIDGVSYKDLYAVVAKSYESPFVVGGYVISMAVLAYHLLHGFQSAFQTLGINNGKYTPIIKKLGVGFSIVVPALFAIIPIVLYVK